MRLRRVFDAHTVRGIIIRWGGRRQHFSPKFVMKGVTQGWLSISRDCIVLHDDVQQRRGGSGATVYRILREPGRYPKPDAASGYEVINWYECDRVSAPTRPPGSTKRVSRGAFLINT